MTDKTKARVLRDLIAQGCVAMPGVPNGAMARQVEQAGFDALYISGAGMANMTAGLPDIGLLTLTEVARLAGYAANAVSIPAIVDADTGFGGVENVARTIRELEAGRAWPVVTFRRPGISETMWGNLGRQNPGRYRRNGRQEFSAAVEARRDEDFLIIARTDSRCSGEVLAAR